jgi:hypothetical protein
MAWPTFPGSRLLTTISASTSQRAEKVAQKTFLYYTERVSSKSVADALSVWEEINWFYCVIGRRNTVKQRPAIVYCSKRKKQVSSFHLSLCEGVDGQTCVLKLQSSGRATFLQSQKAGQGFSQNSWATYKRSAKFLKNYGLSNKTSLERIGPGILFHVFTRK